MPSQWKHPSSGGGGGLGRLLASLRPGRAGPLPVQTGFPTSLADLVVKNHGRLKKPSKPKKRRPSTTPSPPPSPPPPPVAAAAAAAQEKSDLAPVCAVPEHKGAAFRLGLEVLALGSVVALGLLLIWSKKLVACITVLSFALFLLDSVRSSAHRRLKPCAEARKKPDSAMVRLDLDGRGWVSPIREVVVETPTISSTDSDRASDLSIERSDLGVDNSSSNSSNPKAKRSWRKLIAKKLHKNKKGKESDSACANETKQERDPDPDPGEVNAEAEGIGSARIGRSCDQTLPEVAELSGVEGMELSREDDIGERVLLLLVFVSVVLLGLLAGKAVALVVTVLCFMFLSSTEEVLESVPRNSSDVRGS